MKVANKTLRFVFATSFLVSMTAYGYEKQKFIGDGQHFDFVIEHDDHNNTLYLSAKPTNEPVAGITPRLVPDESKDKEVTFVATNKPGIYKAEGNLPEGSLEIIYNDLSESVEVYAEDDGHHDHDHGIQITASGTPEQMRKFWWFIAGLSALVILLGGIILRQNKKLRDEEQSQMIERPVTFVEASADAEINDVAKNAGNLIALLAMGALSFVASEPLSAHEGHSHAEASTGPVAADATVKMSKKSQFLIGLRTMAAQETDVVDSFQTFGHASAKPQLDSLIRAPATGFLRGTSKHTWGSSVKKGDHLGYLDHLGTVTLVAPISGTIIEVKGVDGSRVEAGETLFRIVDTSILWIDAEVFQKDLPLIRNAKEAFVYWEGDTKKQAGTVVGSTSVVDENTLRAKVYIEVQNPEGALTLGGLTQVSVQIPSEGKKGFVLPKAAVLNRGGEQLVFVQTGPEEFKAKPVATAFGTEPGSVVVTAGLEDDDRVVISGNYQLLVGAN